VNRDRFPAELFSFPPAIARVVIMAALRSVWSSFGAARGAMCARHVPDPNFHCQHFSDKMIFAGGRLDHARGFA